ncbi:hypothetical protein FOL47_001864 [Perkinsus chesapeaki]|uniref:Uncharacterized protein n=1 Tax=Perkinsus chesapeaki TaxID=330153 RepID=A0A7J6MGU8_PERCH|nr:hypothetical protein FOL47_001864 [Perkinsus chesapeaki]
MSACCSEFSAWINYLFSTLVFTLGGLIVAASIWYLFSEFSDLVETWMIWIALGGGILLIVLSIVSCCAAKKRKKCLLAFFWCLALVLSVVFLVGSGLSTAFFSVTNELRTTTLLFDRLPTLEAEAYDIIRKGFVEIWQSDNCDVSCDYEELKAVSCEAATCETNVVETQMNDWIKSGLVEVSPDVYEHCVNVTESVDNFESSTILAWCASSTAVISDVRDWSLWAMVTLWIVTLFTFMLAIANCVLFCSHPLGGDRLMNVPLAHSVNVLKV